MTEGCAILSVRCCGWHAWKVLQAIRHESRRQSSISHSTSKSVDGDAADGLPAPVVPSEHAPVSLSPSPLLRSASALFPLATHARSHASAVSGSTADFGAAERPQARARGSEPAATGGMQRRHAKRMLTCGRRDGLPSGSHTPRPAIERAATRCQEMQAARSEPCKGQTGRKVVDHVHNIITH
jgi:hypothetical protein